MPKQIHYSIMKGRRADIKPKWHLFKEASPICNWESSFVLVLRIHSYLVISFSRSIIKNDGGLGSVLLNVYFWIG